MRRRSPVLGESAGPGSATLPPFAGGNCGVWSFAETLRHLVHGIDIWLGKGVLGRGEADFHPRALRSSTRPVPNVSVRIRSGGITETRRVDL